jgi:TonB family protein
LSTGGGGGSGSRLDVADFCCPDYLILMIERIRSNWTARAEAVGETMVKFTIMRDGQIQGVEVEKSSGFAALDINAQRALLVTRQLPALPGACPNPTLTVHLNFEYTR